MHLPYPLISLGSSIHQKVQLSAHLCQLQGIGAQVYCLGLAFDAPIVQCAFCSQQLVSSSPPLSHALLLTSRPCPHCLPSLEMSCLVYSHSWISLPQRPRKLSPTPAFPLSSYGHCPPRIVLSEVCGVHQPDPKGHPEP